MRTHRQDFIDRALIRSLRDCGNYPCPERALKAQVDLFVGSVVTQSEFDDSVRHLSTERLIIDGEGTSDRLWKLTESGRMWAKENRV